MERYENIVKIEEMRKLAENNQYIKAVKILDTMDISKIKALTDLSIIADVYMQNERYDDAMMILTKIYGKTKTRRVLYQLVDLSVKRGSISEAEDYLERYIKIAPQDSSKYIFRYCIDKLNGEPYEILIGSLEQLKEFEYYEMWAYELAKLYHKAGMKDKCVRECSDIILWFGDGIYVEKAKLLKGYYVGDINPIHMLKAKEKKEAEKKLGLDKTKDYSDMRSQIDQFLAEENTQAEYTSGGYTSDEYTSDGYTSDAYTSEEDTLENDQSAEEERQDLHSEASHIHSNKVKPFIKNAYYDYKVEKDDMARIWNEHEEEDKVKEEKEQIKDPELDAFFKKVAQKLEKEIWVQKEAAVENETSEEKKVAVEEEASEEKEIAVEEEASEEKEIAVKEEALLDEMTIEIKDETSSENFINEKLDQEIEETRLEPKEKPEIKIVRKTATDLEEIITEEKKESKQEIKQESKPEIGQENIQNILLEKESDEKDESKDEIINQNGEGINQNEPTGDLGEKFLHNGGFSEKMYLTGKYDSIFSEAGMNFERDFGYFNHVDSLRKEIEACLESILSDYTKINHMIITGEKKSGKTTLAKKISKALYGLNWINTNRVAKISAGKLNGISLESKKDKLVNSSLIIEEAGLLDQSAAEQLLLLIQDLNGNIFVILEDDEISINKLLKKNPKLSDVFSSTIQLPEYTMDDYLGFAFTYIHNNEYEFTREVKTAFEKEIEKIVNTERDENRLEAVMELARRAKVSADERNKILLSDIIRARDLSSEDFLYIKEEDFLWEESMNG